MRKTIGKLFLILMLLVIYAPILILAVLAIIFQIVLSKTIFGRQIYALGSNTEATDFLCRIM